MARSLVIVGAGPAGMAAAIEAVSRGANVSLIDEAARPGGQIYRQGHPALAAKSYAAAGELARKRRLLERFAAVAGEIDYRPNTTAFALFPSRELHVAVGETSEALRSDAVLLATGVRELAFPFPGWTTPGVMFAGGAQALLKTQQVLPGRRAVIAGCGALPLVVTAQLLRAGGTVKALAPLHPLGRALFDLSALWRGREVVREGLGYALSVAQASVERLTGFVPVRAMGRERLEAAVLQRLDGEGRLVPGTEREIACDLLALNYGFLANGELAAMAGAEMRHDALAGGWLPQRDELGRTSVPGLFVAGDGAELRGAIVAELDGRIVGAVAASGDELGPEIAHVQSLRRRHLVFQQALRETFRLPRGIWSIARDDTAVCRCESVTLGQLRRSFAAGHLSLNTVKRSSRAGMGWCGGRSCLHAVAALAEIHGGKTPEEMMTPRPLARPVTFAALAHQRKAGGA